MTSIQIHSALSRPPVFGDVEQIKAIHFLREEDNGRQANIDAGLTEYKVKVTYYCEDVVTVWAEDEDDAEDKAKNECDVDDGDWEIDIQEVEQP